jgi:hypothetical protein
MSWLTEKLFGSKEDREEDAIVQLFTPLYDRFRKDEDKELVGGEEYFFCGLCRGYIPISAGLHPHTN